MSRREAKEKVVAVVEKEEKKRGEKWKKKVCCVSARTTASLVSFCLGKLRWDKMWHAGCDSETGADMYRSAVQEIDEEQQNLFF